MSEENKDLTLNEDNASVEEPTVVQPEPVPEAAPEVGVKKAPKKGTMIAVAVLAVVAIVAGIVAAAASSPVALIGKGINNNIEAIQDYTIVSLLESASKGGSIDVNCDLEQILGLTVESTAQLKVYTGNSSAALVADVEVEGESVFDASAYFDGENFALGSDTIFGEKTYGTSLDSIADNFNDSEFGPDGDFSFDYELTEEDKALLEKTKKSMEEAEALAKDVLGDLLGIVKDNAVITKGKDVLDVGGEEVKVTAVTVEVDGEALAAICVEMMEYLRDNKKLREFAYENATMIAYILDESGLAYLGSMEPEELIDEMYERLDELSDEDMEELVELLEDADVAIDATFYISKSGQELIGANVKVGTDYYEYGASFVAGPSWKDLKEISVRLDDDGYVYKLTYTVETNDKNEYKAKLKLREDGENVLSGKIVWDKKDGDFEAEMTDEWDDSYGIEGSLLVDSKTMTIELDTVCEDSYEMDLGVTVIVSASDKAPKMPSYTDILKMDVDEIEDLVYDAEEILDGALGDALYYYLYYYF